MRKIYYLVLFVSTIVSSQIKMGTYKNGSGKVYDVEVTDKKFINVHIPSTDTYYDDVHFKLSFGKAKVFKEKMTEVKNKFIVWKDNQLLSNTKDLHQKLNLNIGRYDVIFQAGRHHYLSSNTELFAEVNVDENGIYIAIANKDKMQASVNQFITSEGFMFYFHNEKELDQFINSINIVEAQKLITQLK